MDFARRQLEKYGWSDGKGLGKHENGISEALKPKLKRSVTGIGHDAAAEFNEHWWSALYDKAAKNVEVEEKNGKTKRIKTIDGEDFTITNSTWKINKKSKKHNSDNGSEYSDYFIRKAVLTNDGTRVENQDSESESDGEKKDVFKMTDEELFKACEGRTAHKGARHGLKALGKLARIEQQEQMLLTQTKYQGYSHAKKLKKTKEEVVEDTSVADNIEDITKKSKKKKKRKHCSSKEDKININCDQAESEDVTKPNEYDDLQNKNRDASSDTDADFSKKLNKSEKGVIEIRVTTSCDDSSKQSKKNKKRSIEPTVSKLNKVDIIQVDEDMAPKKKKKKRKFQY